MLALYPMTRGTLPLCFLVAALAASCAKAPIPFDEPIGAGDLRSIAIVAAGDASQASIDGSEPRDRRGTVIGAGGGALGGAAIGYGSAGLLCTIGGPLCMLVVIPAAIVGGLAGGVVGNAIDHAPRKPGEEAVKARADLAKAVALLRPSDALAKQAYREALSRRERVSVHESASDGYRALAAQGITAALEVAVTELEVLPRDKDMAVVVKARSRLYRTADGRLLDEKLSQTKTRYRRYEDWAANEAQPLREAVDDAYARLGETIIAGQLRTRTR